MTLIIASIGNRVAKQFASWEEYDGWTGSVPSKIRELYSVKCKIGSRMVTEGLLMGDLRGILVPIVSIDEYQPKIPDSDNVVCAFMVYNVPEAAEPLRRMCARFPGVVSADASDSDTYKKTIVVYVEFHRDGDPSDIEELIDHVCATAELDTAKVSVTHPGSGDDAAPYEHGIAARILSGQTTAPEETQDYIE